LNRSDLAKAAQHLLRLAVEYDLAHADQADYPVLILQWERSSRSAAFRSRASGVIHRPTLFLASMATSA
jgi:hypothetical protein